MPYRLTTIGRWSIVGVWVHIALSVAAFPLLIWQIMDGRAILAGASELIDPGLHEDLASFWLVISVILFGSMIVNAVWLYRASANARAIEPATGRIGPGWSVAWFAIPIANLWMPFLAVKQCWNTSVRGPGNLNAPAPGFMRLWWACWVAALVFGWISRRLARSSEIEDYVAALYLDAASLLPDLVAAILWLRIVREITRAQSAGSHVAEVFS